MADSHVDYYLEQVQKDGTWAFVAMCTDDGMQSHSRDAEFAIDIAKQSPVVTRVVKRTRTEDTEVVY